jgi:hypothetical protein
VCVREAFARAGEEDEAWLVRGREEADSDELDATTHILRALREVVQTLFAVEEDEGEVAVGDREVGHDEYATLPRFVAAPGLIGTIMPLSHTSVCGG